MVTTANMPTRAKRKTVHVRIPASYRRRLGAVARRNHWTLQAAAVQAIELLERHTTKPQEAAR